jgi:DNA-binding CsgD family transcriptional regulator
MEQDLTVRAAGAPETLTRCPESGAETPFLLRGVTEKEREVLDLLIEFKSNKQIARDLGVSENTIDKRLQAIRSKLGTRDRNDTARVYAAVTSGLGKSVSGFPAISDQPWSSQTTQRDRVAPDPLTLQDSMPFTRIAPWEGDWAQSRGLEAIGDRLGPAWRIALVVSIAALLAVVIVACLTIVRQLGDSAIIRLVT